MIIDQPVRQPPSRQRRQLSWWLMSFCTASITIPHALISVHLSLFRCNSIGRLSAGYVS